MNIVSIIRSDLRDFEPYRSARSIYPKGMFLDANENGLGSAVELPLEKELNRYPDPFSTELRSALAKRIGMQTENIFVGNGADESIDLLIRLFVERNEEILITEPTYGMYRVAANVAGVRIGSFPLRTDFSLDVDGLLSRITSETKLIFCCSPNNPTGNMVNSADVERICKNFQGVVVLDEAYIEFASVPSMIKQIYALENLVILRTFSKAWGLAGIRVGYTVANKAIVEYLNKIKPPYNLNRVSAKIALEALTQSSKMLKFRDLILAERARLDVGLADLGFKVFPSEANFLLVRYPKLGAIARRLAEEFGIIIRDVSNQPQLEDCARISVGSSYENDALLAALEKIV